MKAGDRVGSYEIATLIGAGGMGQVFRAHDSRLGRDVAIKALPDAMAADSDRVARFEREARVLAALNHPAIASIYGVEREGGRSYLVLELVPGDTLADVLSRGPIPLPEALGIALQVADALDAAHQRGIVHRDLKPSNIKVTPDARVKVLDFGLAKAIGSDDEPASPSGSLAPTITTPAQTRAGVVMGSAAYMAPEQARGKAVDKRADIWAFGCVLYEMLAGRRTFLSDEVTDTLALILTRDPDWTALPPGVPTSIRTLLRRCLEKDRGKRLADIADARLEIEEARGLAPGTDSAGVVPASRATPAWRRALPWALTAFTLVAAAGAFAGSGRLRQTASGTVQRFTVEVGASPAVTTARRFVISPDGTMLAFIGLSASPSSGNAPTRRLYVRRLDELQATPLAGTENAQAPFFSPDGHWIGFFADGKLKKVAASGGAVVTLSDAAPTAGSWTADGDILLQTVQAAFERGPLIRVRNDSGETTTLFPAKETELGLRWPQLLPGNRVVLATAASATSQRSFDDANIVAQLLASGDRKVLQRGHFARYLPSGHLVFMREGTLFAAPFDVDRLDLTGPAVPVVEGISTQANGTAEFSVSDTGTLVYVPGAAAEAAASPVYWMDAAGNTSALRSKSSAWGAPRVAPDGRRIALAINDGKQTDVWVYEWERDTLTRITSDPGSDVGPIWSPDSRWIAFASVRAGRPGSEVLNLYAQRADGTGDAIRLTDSPESQVPGSWHPNAKVIAFHEGSPGRGRQNIMTLALEGDSAAGWKPGHTSVFVGGPFLKARPSFSPDGRWLAYTETASGGWEVYVRPFPGPGGRWQVSSGGGLDPVWSLVKNEILFRSGGTTGRLWAAPYSYEGDEFRPGKPAPWTPSPIGAPTLGLSLGRIFDLHPDGKRVAVALPAQASPEAGGDKVVVVLNFFDELRRLAPRKTSP